jgi:hypothetical protein
MSAMRRKGKAAVAAAVPPCVGGVCNPRRVQGLKAPAPRGEHVLINIAGPGVFLAGEVVKQGGGAGLSFVSLDIDGRNVVNISYDAARNSGLTEDNPYGVHYLGSAAGLENLTFGWPTPLVFMRSLTVSAVVRQDGVVQILANVIVGG